MEFYRAQPGNRARDTRSSEHEKLPQLQKCLLPVSCEILADYDAD